MSIQVWSDRRLREARESLVSWLTFGSPEEEESGEMDSWRESLKLVDAEIKHRQEQGKETR